MRILPTQDLLPHRVKLCGTQSAGFLDIGNRIHLFAVIKDPLLKRNGSHVIKELSFPCVMRIEDLDGLGIVKLLVMDANQIRLCLAVFVVIETI